MKKNFHSNRYHAVAAGGAFDRDHPYLQGRLSWWYVPPGIPSAGSRWWDLYGKNNGTLVNSLRWAQGKYGPAPNFNLGERVTCADPNGRLAGMATLAVGAWYFARSGGGNNLGRLITCNDISCYAIYYGESSNSTNLTFVVNTNPRPLFSVSHNAWHRALLLYDGVTVRGYADGRLVASASQTGNVTASTSGVVIGDRITTSRGWDGFISDVFVAADNRLANTNPDRYAAMDYELSLTGYRTPDSPLKWVSTRTYFVPDTSPLLLLCGSTSVFGSDSFSVGA